MYTPDVERVERRVALTVAGSDSGGGAGIQADLKTFSAFRVYGVSAITAVTAQNIRGIRGVHGLPADFVALQLEAVLGDLEVHAAKTGMLYSDEIVGAVAGKMEEHDVPHLVVDPVMAAGTGETLLSEEGILRLKEALLPLAEVVTPNLAEAEVLSEIPVNDVAGMRRAAQIIHSLGPRHVLIKGGHLEGDPIDLLYDGREYVEYRAQRIGTHDPHGTGCAYSAAIASALARGLDEVRLAVELAKRYISEAIRCSFEIGGRDGPVDHGVLGEWTRSEY